MANEDVLLKLVMQGINPAEAQRVASSSLAALEAELRASMGRQVEAHRYAANAQDRETQKQAQSEIRETTKRNQEIIKGMRAVEAEAKRAAGSTSTNWRRTLEDLENISTITMAVRGSFASFIGVIQTLKGLGDEISRTTQLYGSLEGSIDSFREATGGEIANMDLVIARNDAFQKGLNLTDEQFQIAGGAAKIFADALRVDTKDALTQVIDGLATGRTKMLEHAGVVLNTEKAYQDYAAKIGVSTDRLTEHEKKMVLIQTALRAMDEKIVKAGQQVRDFGSDWEKTTAQIKNAWDDLLIKLGAWIQKIEENIVVNLPNLFKVALAKIKDIATLNHEHFEDQARAAWGAELEQFAKASDQVAKAQERLKSGDAYKYSDPGFQDVARKAEPAKPVSEFERMMREAAARSREEQFSAARRQAENDQAIADILGGPGSRTGGFNVDEFMSRTRDESIRNAFDVTSMDDMKGGNTQKLIEKLEEEVKAAQTKMYEDLKETNDKAGGGVFARLLFGPEGPDKIYEEMDYFQQKVVDSMGMLSQAGDQMAGAFGQAFAAAASGEKSFGEAMKEGARNVIKSLAAQAAEHAAMEVALGLASLALGPIGGVSASAHFAAAAAFGALALGSGAALAAIGPGSSGAGSSASSANTPTSTRGPNTFAPASRSQDNSGADMGPVTINLSVYPGGEAEAGRSIVKALAAYKAQTGKELSL